MRLSTIVFCLVGMVAAKAPKPSRPARPPFDQRFQSPAGNVAASEGGSADLYSIGPAPVTPMGFDRGNFKGTITYKIYEGFACSFLTEDSAQWSPFVKGPATNVANPRITYYDCKPVKPGEEPKSDAPVETPMPGNKIIPCGNTHVPNGGQLDLMETGKGNRRNFAINGEPYHPNRYHVSHRCHCSFFSGKELLAEVEGSTEGTDGVLPENSARTYVCYR